MDRRPVEQNHDQEDRRHTLLIAEDSALVRTRLKEILGIDYELILVKNGRDGIARLVEQAGDISAVLLAVKLPVMDGYRFMEIVNGDPSWRRIPILILAEEASAEDEERCLELGACDFLERSASAGLIRTRIANAIRMSEITQALRELERDELTGVYTRQAFLRRAAEQVKAHPECEYGIIALEVENFKQANVLYGEERCDELLAYLGATIREHSLHSLVGRFDGDRFVVLYEISEETRAYRLNHMRARIMQDAPIPDQIAKVGVYAPIDRNAPIVHCCDRALHAIRGIKKDPEQNVAHFESYFREKDNTDQ